MDKLPFTNNSLAIFKRRYLNRDEDGNFNETPEQVFARVCKALADVEKGYNKNESEVNEIRLQFEDIMSSFEFIPAGRTLTNTGTQNPVVANCIVLNIEDSMDSIFNILKDAAVLSQAGSGLGFPFHLLRPAGMVAKKSNGVSSGPVSFLRVYNAAFSVVFQQNRNAANMAVMSIDHPDILEFIDCKRKEGDISLFNISIALTNEFMEAVVSKDEKPWYCKWKEEKMKPRLIYRDKWGHVSQIDEVTMTAHELFDRIVDSAWSNGEPGIVFLDKVNETNQVPGLGRIEACNPCGEQFLHSSDVCNLGSLNLEKFVKNSKIDFERLKHVTKVAIRMLDNVVDVSTFPVESINNVSKDNRRLGLGVMGFADMLYLMGIPYNSEEGINTAKQVMETINTAAHLMSHELALEKGTFKNYDKSIYAPQKYLMRNAACTTVAPTGSISLVFEVSGGVEPYFALSYFKNAEGMDPLIYTNKHLLKALKDEGLATESILKKIAREGSVQNIDEITDKIKKIYVCSMDISPIDHIKMQAAFQQYVDNSISKTCNFPNDSTKEDVASGYILAWQMGCKGCTVYRDGSRVEQVLTLGKDKQ